jgi:small conductance mechanosensitive channel
MVSNIIGGFTILYTHPFHSGDYVEIAGQGGVVKEINMSYTMLATADNKLISIPNSAVVAAQIVNYSAAETRRVEVLASASYDVPTQKVIDALVQAGTVDKVLLDPAPMAVVTAYGDSAISYSLRLWVRTPDYWDVYFQVNQRVKDVFDQQDIEMTYPHLNVHIQQ